MGGGGRGVKLIWLFQVFGGKLMFFRYLRVIGRCRKLLGRFPTYSDPCTRPWCRAMAEKAIIKAPCGQIWTRLGQSEAPCFPYLLLGVLEGFWGQFRGVIRTNKDPEKCTNSWSKSLIKPF